MRNRTQRRGVHGLQTKNPAFSTILCLLFLGSILAGCEARLDLSRVNAQLSLPTQRSDLFQAVDRHQDRVVAVGGMGVVVQSDDGGGSWQRTTLTGNPFLVDVTACADGAFHAIEKTDGIWSLAADGHWERQALPEMTEPQAMTCDAAGVIWVVGGFSTILHSDDAGANWESWTLDEDLYLTTIQFVDRQHGVVTGEFGTVLLTADSGLTWDRADDLPGSFYPQSTFFTSPDKGWVVGLNGTIWKTGDRAQSWQSMQNGIKAPLYGITGFGNTLVAVGDNATILYYIIGNSSWTPLDGATHARTYLRGITDLGKGQFVVAGGGTLFAVSIPDSDALASLEVTDE